VFSHIVHSLNTDPDLAFGSAVSLNLDPNLGSVQVGSGLNRGSEPNISNTNANQTGIDLSHNQFAEKFQQLDTPDAILELLQEREKAFKEYRDGNRRLINCLNPAVRILHVLSGTLGEALSLVSHLSLVPICIPAMASDLIVPGSLFAGKGHLCWH
jgi:hypothetical protein